MRTSTHVWNMLFMLFQIHKHCDAIVCNHSKNDGDPNFTVLQEGGKEENQLNNYRFTDIDITISGNDLASIDIPGLTDVLLVQNRYRLLKLIGKKKAQIPKKNSFRSALGLAYQSYNRSAVKAKSVREITNYQRKCAKILGEMERHKIFHEYWSMDNQKSQQDYIMFNGWWSKAKNPGASNLKKKECSSPPGVCLYHFE